MTYRDAIGIGRHRRIPQEAVAKTTCRIFNGQSFAAGQRLHVRVRHRDGQAQPAGQRLAKFLVAIGCQPQTVVQVCKSRDRESLVGGQLQQHQC